MPKYPPLRGCSQIILPDGTVKPVRDLDGNLVMDPEEWEQNKRDIAKNLSRTVSDMVTNHPELRRAFGLAEGQSSATVRLMDILLDKEKAPASVGAADRRKGK